MSEAENRPLETTLRPALSRAQLAWRLAVSVAIGLLNFGPEFLIDYPAGNDESWMMQAGFRLGRGEGLTFYKFDWLTDLSAPNYQHLHLWPPLFSWIVAGLTALGLSVEWVFRALKLIKLLAAVVGAFGWLRLADRVGPPPLTGLFAAGLSTLFFGHEPFAGPSHLLMWALLPVVFHKLLDGLATGRSRDFALAGAAVAVCLGLRYAAVFLLGAGGLLILLGASGRFAQRLRLGVVFGLPVLLAGLALMAYTRANSEHLGWTADRDPEWRLANLAHDQPLRFAFAWGFGLEDMLVKLRPKWSRVSPAWFLPWYGVLAAAFAAALLLRRGEPSDGPDRGRFLLLTLLAAVGLVGLIGMISFRSRTIDDWVPISDPRIYIETSTAVSLAWLAVLVRPISDAVARAQTDGTRPSPLVLLPAGVLVMVVVLAGRETFRTVRFHARSGIAALRDGVEREAPLVAAVRQVVSERPVPAHRVWDNFTGTGRKLRCDDGVHASRFRPPEVLLPGSGNSAPVYVVIVRRWKGDPSDPDRPPEKVWDTDTASAYIRFWGLRKVRQLPDDWMTAEIYAGVVPPYPKGSRAAEAHRAIAEVAAGAEDWPAKTSAGAIPGATP